MKPSPRLDRRTLREIQGLLADKEAQLKDSMRGLLSQRRNKEVAPPGDSADQAGEILDDENQAALLDSHARQLAQVEAALERLAGGEHGLCQECGEFIGVGRLRALPFALRCTACQSRAELHAPGPGRSVAFAPAMEGADHAEALSDIGASPEVPCARTSLVETRGGLTTLAHPRARRGHRRRVQRGMPRGSARAIWSPIG